MDFLIVFIILLPGQGIKNVQYIMDQKDVIHVYITLTAI